MKVSESKCGRKNQQLALNYQIVKHPDAGIHERWNVSEEDDRVTDAGMRLRIT